MVQLDTVQDELFSGLASDVSADWENTKPENDIVLHKSPTAFKTISEVATMLELPQHVLRFWESRFKQIKPTKLRGGRRYYRPEDIEIISTIKHLLYTEGYTIDGAKRALDQVRKNKKQAEMPVAVQATLSAIVRRSAEELPEMFTASPLQVQEPAPVSQAATAKSPISYLPIDTIVSASNETAQAIRTGLPAAKRYKLEGLREEIRDLQATLRHLRELCLEQ